MKIICLCPKGHRISCSKTKALIGPGRIFQTSIKYFASQVELCNKKMVSSVMGWLWPGLVDRGERREVRDQEDSVDKLRCSTAPPDQAPNSTVYCAGQGRIVMCAVQCSLIQCSVVQCSAVQCSTVQCRAALCNTVKYSAVQCSAVQCSAVQLSVLVFSTVQHGSYVVVARQGIICRQLPRSDQIYCFTVLLSCPV